MGAARESTQMENSYTASLRVTRPLHDRDTLLPPRPPPCTQDEGGQPAELYLQTHPLYTSSSLPTHVSCSVSLVTRAEEDEEGRKAPHICLRINSFECLLHARQQCVLGAGSLREQNKGPALRNSRKREAGHGRAPERRAGRDLLLAVCAYKLDSLVSSQSS